MWLGLFCNVLVVLIPLIQSMYEDQVQSYDWHKSYIGTVSYVSVDQSATKGNRGTVVASEKGVLAVLNQQDGSIRWRQIYEPGPNGYINAVLRNKYNSLVTVSHGGQLLRSWDIHSGLLKYEVPTFLPYQMESAPPLINHVWRPGGVQATLAGKKAGVIVVASGSKVVGFLARSGDQKWTHSIEADSNIVCGTYGLKDSVYILSVVGDILQAIQLNVSTGSVLLSYKLHVPWMSLNTTNCLLSGSHVICVDGMRMEIYHASLLDTTPLFHTSLLPLTTPTTLSLLRAVGPGDVWIKDEHSYWLVQFRDGVVTMDTKVESGFPLVGAVSGSGDDEVDVRVEVGGGHITVAYYNDGSREVCGVYSIHGNRGTSVEVSIQLSQADQSVTCRVAMVMEDNSIILFGKDDDGVEEVWVREDGLGDINNLLFLDLPADQSALIENFLENTRSEVNPLKLALQRWQLQINLIKDLVRSVEGRHFGSLLRGEVTTSDYVRDQFNTRKIIIAATTRGKVYGLDSVNGGVVWQLFFDWLLPLDDVGGVPFLYILRSTGHPLHPPLAVLLGRSKHPSCLHTALVTFNPLVGVANGDPTPIITCLPDILQTFLITKEDKSHSKVLLILTKQLEVISYPSSPEVTFHLTQLEEQLFFYVADKGEGHMDGYYIEKTTPPSLEHDFRATHLWHVAFPTESETIVGVVTKPLNEHVSAMGRSRVDGSIQYKYLNPNLVAVITESADSLRPFISIYLVDVVTGGVIFHAIHKAGLSPVHLVHSENWMVYQFQNAKQYRNELVVVELFEKDSNITHTVWSSLTPPPPPQVLSQAYAVASSFATIATTQTRRGITTKSILVGLKSGHIAAIPKTFLDPRRNVEITDEMKEAGLPLYQPELRFSPNLYINYNQTIGRLKSIHSIPSGLESTSLVLACGLDLYFTRVLPSKQFDLLAVDFDYTLVAGVLVAMVIGTIVLAKLSAKKSLNVLWK